MVKREGDGDEGEPEPKAPRADDAPGVRGPAGYELGAPNENAVATETQLDDFYFDEASGW